MDKEKKIRYEHWLAEVGEWAGKYGITQEQAIQIVFQDHVSGLRISDLHWKEADEFVDLYFRKKKK